MSLQTSVDAKPVGMSAEILATNPSKTPCQESHTALECLARVATHHGVDLPAERLRYTYAVDGAPIPPTLLLRMAKEAGLRAKRSRFDWDTLFRLGEAYPVLARLTNGNWIVVLGAGTGPDGEEMVSVVDPLAERQDEPLLIGKERFCQNWSGEIILIKRNHGLAGSQQSFGFRWFVPELLREWRLFIDVAIAAILLYALGLATPIFFQLVIDKVLVHESFTTLYVLFNSISNQVRLPAELKHINKRRKRN